MSLFTSKEEKKNILLEYSLDYILKNIELFGQCQMCGRIVYKDTKCHKMTPSDNISSSMLDVDRWQEGTLNKKEPKDVTISVLSIQRTLKEAEELKLPVSSDKIIKVFSWLGL